MFRDIHKEVKAIRRRMVRRARMAGFVGAAMAHLVASFFLLLWQTSCVYPRCVDGLAFDTTRALLGVPLFVTPWLSLPTPEADFNEGWILFGLLIGNAVSAVACWWAAGAGVHHAYAWCTGRISRYRAS